MKNHCRRIVAIAGLSMLVALAPAPLPAQESTGLLIGEHALGARIVDRELVERGDTFAEGSRVYFWTRVVGGQPGDRIQHVWIHGGKEVVTVGLGVGGPHWRTYSRKMLHPGSIGAWVVEARSPDGEVLARAEFNCVPPGDGAAGETPSP
jgi:hypothetical protein